MASETPNIVLNNYSDDAQIKKYMTDVLMPRVFHDVPINSLNSGFFSLVSEYIAQTTENLAFTSSFYLNESFITKAVLADSIYAEAAIFNLGYAFATPSACNFMIELKIEDIMNNAVDSTTVYGVKEFVLDKNTKINLKNGSVYSLDYDVLIQYTGRDNPKWNIQYTNTDEQNSIAINKKPFILYRTSGTWLHLFVKMSEISRQTHVVVNNMTNGIPIEDKVITCSDQIAGFEVKYIDGRGNGQYLDRDHILPIHSDVKDQQPYIHYIMDSSNTIRFMFQKNGNRYFVPQLDSSFEITIYTCHGEAANFDSFKVNESVSVITSMTKYANNGNVQKTAFVTSGSEGGTNIGTVETTRRETIEAYNTANVISSDHDIYEWFKTFFFKHILYPFFFKRRDDPWGRIWSGFMALTDLDGEVFRTNTLHAKIPYRLLYANNDNIISNDEIIIPPGWAWVYDDPDENRYTIRPLAVNSTNQIETASTALNVDSEFVFANPFGIRIQKYPFAIGYFNPWINEDVTASLIPTTFGYTDNSVDDASVIYHGTPAVVNVKRTYKDDYYKLSTVIMPNQSAMGLVGSQFVKYMKVNTTPPQFTDAMWTYFVKPSDVYASTIPILVQNEVDQFLAFNPEHTFFCVRKKYRQTDGLWSLEDYWIEDNSNPTAKIVMLPMSGFSGIVGLDSVWGDEGLWKGYEVKVSGNTDITMYPIPSVDCPLKFTRRAAQNYYELRLKETEREGRIVSLVTHDVYPTSLTKYGETMLYRIGRSYSAEPIWITVTYDDGIVETYQIQNAANIYIPFTPIEIANGDKQFNLNELMPDGIILYADMKPTAAESAIDYYRVPLSLLSKNTPIFELQSTQLHLDENNLRVILEASVNGIATGHIEMQPVEIMSDGSILFESTMYPLNKMVDIDNRIQIASINRGGGAWIPETPLGTVSVDATEPELVIKILFKSDDPELPSPIPNEDYKGYRLQDLWKIDDLSLVQELKEMRSVVNFGEYIEPSAMQITAYDSLMNLIKFNLEQENLYTIKEYAYHLITGTEDTSGLVFEDIKRIAGEMTTVISGTISAYSGVGDVPVLDTETTRTILADLDSIVAASYQGDVDWEEIYRMTASYASDIDDIFADTYVNSALTIQLTPVVQSTLMLSDSFETFVSAFTQVHKAIEPVIFRRLEGNNYLDCKLIATYGLPHSYVADVDKDLPSTKFWPDLNVQIEFDVKLYNPALRTNTLNELRTIIRSYFNRLTTVHTPVDQISMDNNIYLSQLIQLLEEHSNVQFLKFKGWYTNEKSIKGGKYMNADYQAIVQKWDRLDDMPTDELERYVPEMFVLDDANIVLNVL